MSAKVAPPALVGTAGLQGVTGGVAGVDNVHQAGGVRAVQLPLQPVQIWLEGFGV